MQISTRAAHVAIVLASVSMLALMNGRSQGEPVLNQVLSGATAIPAANNGCASLRIGFNFRVRYVSHFPTNGGTELRIKVAAIDKLEAKENITAPRESVRAPNIAGVPIRGIEFEANGSGPLLVVFFDEPVNYAVSQGNDFTSIDLRLAGPSASEQCKKSLALRPPAADAPDTARKQTSGGGAAAASSENVEKLIADARTAIAKEDYGRATQLLTKLAGLPAHEFSAEAQELLGVVRERRGQMSHAKAEYEAYLKAYPTGQGAARVRQRLAAIITAESALPQKLRKAGSGATSNAQQAAAKKDGAPQEQATSGGAPDEPQAVEDPTAFEWNFSGSLSQFYFRNQEFTKFTEFESRRTTNDDDVFQNSLLTSLDLIATAENDGYRFKSRFSGAHDADFTDGTQHDYRVSAAYAELELKEPGLLGRVGRQSRHSGGILGRFDGAFLSWQASEQTTVNIASGSPVDSSRDEPFLYDRYFFGASVDIEDIFGGFDLTLFGVEQRADSLVDRRAVGNLS